MKISAALFVEKLRATSFLRVIPVERSVGLTHRVSSYDLNREYIKSKDRIAVAECICRSQKGKLGKACDRSTETCMIFDGYADYFVENKQGRAISKEEALEIQDRCEEQGLVSMGSNISNMGIVLCPLLRMLLHDPFLCQKAGLPAEVFVSNYYAAVDADVCSGCEACIERCYMAALHIEDGVAAIHLDRCIGCGVCMPVCPEEALSLVPKPTLKAPMDANEAAKKMKKIREPGVF